MTSETVLEVDDGPTDMITHTPSSPFSTPRHGRKKKKGALAKLAEKKRSAVSEIESNYGSAVSLLSDVDLNQSANQNGGTTGDAYVSPLFNTVADSSNTVVSDRAIPSEREPQHPGNIHERLCDIGQIVNEPAEVSNPHKVRAVKVTPTRSSSVESLKNSKFSPRPPTTPRKKPPETAKPDYMTTVEKDLGFVAPSKFADLNDSNIKQKAHQVYRDKDDVDTVDSSPFINNRLLPSQLTAPSTTHSDIGSATDLQGMADRYMEILSKDAVPPDSARSQGNGFNSRTGRLTPLAIRNHPPFLPVDYSSSALRTANKTDSTFRANRIRSDQMSGSHFDTISHSLGSSSALPLVTTKEAKARSYLLGSINNSALLGAEELDRYFPDRKLHIFVGCWNMAELKDCTTSLDDFILPDNTEFVQDLYVIGTQENNTSKKEWEVKIQETLGPSHVLLHSATHGALHLAVFIRRDLIWFCSVPESDIVTTRAVTMVKTKGAVAISFTFFGTSLLFINSHFTSDDSKIKNRIADYKKIVRGLNLPKVSSTSPKAQTSTEDITEKFDAVFWCGDLNFRIDRHRDHVENMLVFVTSQLYPNFEHLIASDQLTKCISQDQIFVGFQEGRIGFKPTYKFDIGSDTYDTSHKLRIPSYTDRVLFRSKKKNATCCILYDAVMSVKVSDHRPVFGLFETALRPGRDNIPLAAGQFDRSVYIEANKRRALHRAVKPHNHKSSSVCSLQ